MSISIRGVYNNLLKVDEWNVGVIAQPISDFLTPCGHPKISWLPTLERGRFLADPFGLVKDNRVFILCEEFNYADRRGKIVCYEEGEDHTFVTSRVAIDLPIHISHPYLLTWKDEIYCVPETNQAREVMLYRAREFPYSWQKVGTLIKDFAGLESTIFKFSGRWWLTCTSNDEGDIASQEKLFIWHAEELGGPWEPHTANPVKVNLSSSRPAGTPFLHEGHLYRPSMDCSHSYGKNIVINRIKRLTTEEFEEEEVITLKPLEAPYLDGLHTLSSIGSMTAIDGRRYRFVASRNEISYNIANQRHHLFQRLTGQRR